LVQDAQLVTGKQFRQYLASYQSSMSLQLSAEPWLSPLLTLREKQVVKAISEGSTVPEFAKREGISLQTAKTYARDARRKLGVSKQKSKT
jgi:DNA-binding CsgD family transcriptional regulator